MSLFLLFVLLLKNGERFKLCEVRLINCGFECSLIGSFIVDERNTNGVVEISF